eukprot:6213056-Pleurochrysis_carterae.AAC.1
MGHQGNNEQGIPEMEEKGMARIQRTGDGKRGWEAGKRKRERTYGIKHWGRVRTIPRIHLQVKNFCKWGLDDFSLPGMKVKTPEMGA